MVGWWTGTTSTFVNRMYYGVYIYHNSIQVRTAVTAVAGIHQLANNTNSVGTKWRLKIRLKAAGGAMVELFKDGDFTTPYGSYDYGTSGTLANLGFGVGQYRPGNSDIKLEQVAIGSQPATTTISGNGIQTGAIESTNWNNNNAGSRLNLIGGTLELGGATTSAKLYFDGTNLTLAGSVTANAGAIGGVNIGSSKIYVGTGTVNNSNTGFYLDSSGNFSLKNKLYWNGSTLAINGTVTATAGAIGGTTINSTELRSTSNMPAPDGQAKFKLANSGAISGSNLFIRQVANLGNGNERIDLINTQIGLIDGRNMGRQVVSNFDYIRRGNVDDGTNAYEVNKHYFHLLPYENSLSITFTMAVNANTNGIQGRVQFVFEYQSLAGAYTSNTISTGYTSFTNNTAQQVVTRTSSGTSTYHANGANTFSITIPEAAQAKAMRVIVKIGTNAITSGASLSKYTILNGYAITACRKLVAETAGNALPEDLSEIQ